MLFNSFTYLVFLPAVLAVYWLVPFKLRTLVLLIASYIFYMSFRPEYGILILGMTAVNYFFGLAIARSTTKRKLLFILGILTNVLLLAYFKYTDYGLGLVNQFLCMSGKPLIPHGNIILPLGISFFVFEFIHYLIDVYKGGEPVKGPVDFAVFAAFFPTQIAGPIKRYQDFVLQLKVPGKVTMENFDEAMELIIAGLFKKVVIADNLAVPVQTVFSNYSLYTAADLWLAAWAFSFQVYFDFCGYTDVARGSALLLGFRVPLNFDLPYMASSVTDFWRRWHISLSTWLRDYIFFPLGGSRFGWLATHRNLILTMAICGLWHGAGTHFIVFGVISGVLLVIHREFQHFTAKHAWLQRIVQTKAFHIFAILLTFNTISYSEVMFRAEDVPTGFAMMKRMVLLTTPESVRFWQVTLTDLDSHAIYLGLPIVLLLLFAGQIIAGRYRALGAQMILPLPRVLAPLKPVYLAVAICLLIAFSPDINPRFVYFQF